MTSMAMEIIEEQRKDLESIFLHNANALVATGNSLAKIMKRMEISKQTLAAYESICSIKRDIEDALELTAAVGKPICSVRDSATLNAVSNAYRQQPIKHGKTATLVGAECIYLLEPKNNREVD